MAALPPGSPPVLVAPGPYEVSFGRIAGRVGPGTKMVIVSIDGRVAARRDLNRNRFDFRVELPRHDVRLTVTAVVDGKRRSSTTVQPVFGLPGATVPRGPPRRSSTDQRLARTLRALAHGFPGTCAIHVQDLRTGAGAAWNARTRFPAASTLKVAIAVEVLRNLEGKPRLGSRIDRLLRSALIPSSDRAANDLLVWLGGSTSAGAARVNATMHAIGMADTDMYGGYIVQGRTPSFVGKRTTASDLARLMRSLHLAAEGKGRLARRGSFTPTKARFLLYLLAHTQVSRIDRFLHDKPAAVLQKAGWITKARHDAGLVYWNGGAFLAVVLTWNERGVGGSSDVLAGHVGRAAYLRFTRPLR